MQYFPHCWPPAQIMTLQPLFFEPNLPSSFYLSRCPPITPSALPLSTNPVGQALFITGCLVLTGPIHPQHVHMPRNVFQEYLVHAPVHADSLESSSVWLMASWPWASSTHSLILSLSIGAFLLLSIPNIFRSFTFCYMNFVLLLVLKISLNLLVKNPPEKVSLWAFLFLHVN